MRTIFGCLNRLKLECKRDTPRGAPNVAEADIGVGGIGDDMFVSTISRAMFTVITCAVEYSGRLM